MKKKLLLVLFLASQSTWGLKAAIADFITEDPRYDPTDHHPTFMLGVAYNLSGNGALGNLGFTGKLISTNEEHQWVGALGATFYPWSADRFGVDLSIGRNFSNGAALIGYDFLKKEPQISGGWTNTEDGGKKVICSPGFIFDKDLGLCVN